MTKQPEARSQNRYRGMSEDERRARRRAKLIDAGLELFGTSGYASSSVKSVCIEAGLTERYFYESFENREALLVAVYEHVALQLIGYITERVVASATQDPDDVESGIRGVLGAVYQFLRDDVRAARILVFEGPSAAGLPSQRVREGAQSIPALIVSDAVLDLENHGDPTIDTQLLATGIVGSITAIGEQWIIEDFRTPIEQVVSTATAVCIAVVRHFSSVDIPSKRDKPRS